MANANTILVNLKMVSDISDVKSNVSQLQNVFNKIDFSKMGKTGLKSNLNKIFTDIEKEANKIQNIMNSNKQDKSSAKQLESSYTKINSLMTQMQVHLGKIKDTDLQKVFNLDASGLKTLTDQLQQAQNKLQSLSTSPLEKIKTNLDILFNKGRGQKTIPIIQGLLEDFNKADTIAEKSNLIQQALNKVQSNLKRTTDTTYKGYYQEVEKQLKSLQDILNSVDGQKIEELQSKIQNFKSTELEKFVAEFQKLTGINLTNLIKGTQELGNKTATAAKQTAQMGSEIEQLKSRITYFFGLANGVQIFQNAVRKAVQTVQTLDKTMTEAAVVTEFSVGDMWDKLPQYTNEASKLGAEINDLYGATTLYYQQGLKTNEAMSLGIETMKMARIAGMEAADATQAMTAALRGFNMEINETSAQTVNDVYSRLAAVTAADTEQIATAMSKTASIAHNANMEFNTTAALLAQIIETTQEAPETAGTAMKTIIARFTEVKKLFSEGELTGTDEEGEAIEINKIDEALRSVGISLRDFLSGKQGIDDVFLQLAEKWDGLDIATQRYIATIAAGSRQQSRFIAMMSDYDRTMELVNEANSSAGASQNQFNKTMDSLESKINQLKNAWNEFLMGLANNDFIKGAIDLLTNLLTGINKLIDGLSGGNGLAKSLLSIGFMFGGLKIGKTIFDGIFAHLATVWKKAGTDAAVGFQGGFFKGFKEIKNKFTKLFHKTFWVGEIVPKGATQSLKDLANAQVDVIKKQRIYNKAVETTKGTHTIPIKSKQMLVNSERAYQAALAQTNSLLNLNQSQQTAAALAVSYGASADMAAAAALSGLTQEKVESIWAQITTTKMSEGEAKAKFKEAFATQYATKMQDMENASTEMGLFTKIGYIAQVLFGNAATRAEAGAKLKSAGAQWALNAAVQAFPIGWVIAAVAAVAALIAVYAQYQKAASAKSTLANLEGANSLFEEQKKLISENIDKIDDFNTSLEETNNKMKTLVKGSIEWRQALLDNNQSVLEMARNFPELYDKIKVGENGQLSFSEETLRDLEDKQTQQLEKVTNLQLAINPQITQAKLDVQAEDLAFKEFALLRTGLSALPLELQDEASNFLKNNIKDIAVKVNNYQGTLDSTEDIQNFLLNNYGTEIDLSVLNMPAFQEALLDCIPALQDFGKTVQNSDLAVESQEKLWSENLASQEGYSEAYGAIATQLKDNAIQNHEAMSTWEKLSADWNVNNMVTTDKWREDVLEKYVTSMNESAGFEKYRIKDNGDLEYRESSSGNWEITTDIRKGDIDAYVAALESTTKAQEEFTNTVEELINWEKNNIDSEIYQDDLLARLISGEGKTLSINELINLSADAELQKTIQDYFDEEGIEINIEEKLEFFNASDYEDTISRFNDKGFKEDFLKDLTYDGFEALKNLEAQFAIRGANILDVISLLQEQGLDTVEISDILTQLQNIDITDANAWNDLKNQLALTYPEIAKDEEAFDALITEAIELAGAVNKIDLQSLTDQIRNLLKLEQDIFSEDFNTSQISKEVYDGFKDAFNENDFRINSDGETYSYVGGNKEDFQRIARDYRQQLSQEGFEVYEAQIKIAENTNFEYYKEQIDQAPFMTEDDQVNFLEDYIQNLINAGLSDDLDKAGLAINSKTTRQDLEDIYTTNSELFNKIFADTTNFIATEVDSLKEAYNSAINQTEFNEQQQNIQTGQIAAVGAQALQGNAEAKLALELEAQKVSGYEAQIQELEEQYGKSYEKAKDFYNQIILQNNKARKASEELRKSLEDNIEILESGPNADGYYEALNDVTEKLKEVGNSDYIDTAFVEENINLINQAYNGSAEAVEQLNQKLLEYTKEQYALEVGIDFEDDAISRMEIAINQISKMKPVITAEGDADFTLMIEKAMRAGASVAEAIQMVEKLHGVELVADIEWEDFETIAYDAYAKNSTIITQIPKKVSFKDVGNKGGFSVDDFKPKSSGGGGGGGSEKEEEKPEKWKNEYDYFYNTTEALNEALREREKLERKYDRLLKNRKTTAEDLIKNSQKEIEALQKQIDLNTTLQKGRLSQLKNVGNETYRGEDGEDRSYASLGVTRYARYDESLQQIVIDWQGINQITDNELGSAVSDYISRLEELQDQFEETQDQIEDIQDQIEEIQERGKEEYLDFEQTIYDALVQREQKVIDEFQQLSDTINNTNSNILNALQESVDLERQIRDNTKTEDEIADMEARLSYLRMDTSGANALEILELEKQLAEKREGYQDNLVDQEIDRLGKINDDAAEQRERQISIMQAQLDYQAENGYYWNQVTDLINRAWGSNGEFNVNSDLARLLQETEAYKSMSEFGRLNWINELIKRWNTSLEGYSNLKVEQLQQAGTTAGNKVIDNSGMDLGTLEYNANNRIWQNNQTGEGYTSLSYDKESNQFTASGYTDAYVQGFLQHVPGNGKNLTTQEIKWLQRGLNRMFINEVGDLAGIPGEQRIGITGQYDKATEDKVKRLQWRLGITQNGLWDEVTKAKFDSMEYAKRFKTGGLADFTGPAWLDGTKSKPEIVLNQQDSQNFIQLKDILSEVLSSAPDAQKTNNGDNYFDIQIHVDELSNDYDVDQLSDKIRRELYNDGMYRNVNTIHLSR